MLLLRMISIIRIFFISILLLTAACRNNSFSLEFELSPEINANYKIAYYASDSRGGMLIETVAPVVGGKAVVKGRTVRPSIVYISGTGKIPMAIYAQRGHDIKITGKSPNPYSWDVDGNDINKELSAWRQQNAEILASDNMAKRNEAVGEFVMKDPSSPLSALLLLTEFSRKENEHLFRRLWLALEDDARHPKWTDMIGRADQPDNYVKTPGKLKTMAVRSLHHGIDTIRTESVNATLLFFWNSGFGQRKEYVDSIRKLAAEYPDSTTRVIADICLEADSIAWKSPLRSDSIKAVIRGWMPAGLADSRLISLNVTRSPFFIVFSPDGNQRYRGSDPADALSSFREVYPPSKKHK